MKTPVHGFHDGERAVQQQAGVALAAARLEGMLDAADLSAGAAAFLAEQSFLALSGRDHDGRLWVSPLVGPPGFVQVANPTTLGIRAVPLAADPLAGLAADQPVGLIALDYGRRRRLRLNGTLTTSDPDQLVVTVDEAYGNCPQFIPQRAVQLLGRSAAHPEAATTSPAPSANLADNDRATIARSDTFILGTSHPECGNDASHRGGPPGFVRTDGDALWWPDYPGNNMFNSLGNLLINPEAALLILDFSNDTALHLTGTARLEQTEVGTPGDDGRTGRRVVFEVASAARSLLDLHSDLINPYPRNPPISDSP